MIPKTTIREEVDKLIKDTFRPPNSINIFDLIAKGDVSFEELQEMVGNDEYLKDYIMNL